jgi:cell wall assembly regulator SMI1
MTNIVLRQIDTLLRERRPSYYAALQKPATPEEIEALRRLSPTSLPDAFVQLYEWKNGQDPDCYEPLHRNRMLMPALDVCETKEMLDGMIGMDFEDPNYWKSSWIPFLSNGGGSYLCLDTSPTTFGQLIAFWKADGDRPTEFASVENWLSDVASHLAQVQ